MYDHVDERQKIYHDFPLRVYVVAKTGPFPWQWKALNYVWSSNYEKGEFWESPYTKKSVDIALNGISDNLGQWYFHKRNLKKDFLLFHNLKIDHVNKVLFMVDTDQTLHHSIGFYKQVYFSK